MDLTEEEKRAVLQQYLGNFYTYFDDNEEAMFQEHLPEKLESSVIFSDFETLKKVMCYILLREEKRIIYYFLKTNDVLDKMLSDYDDPTNEDYTFKDMEEVPLLIIYHPRIWKKNKIMWETLNYLMTTREAMNLKTIIITDAVKLADEHGSLEWNNEICFSNGKVVKSSIKSNSSLGLYGD